MKIIVNYNDNRWKRCKIDFAKIAEAITGYTHQSKAYDNSEVSIILTNDSEIQMLNKKYRSINKPTNVLSFETGDQELLGDIFISFDTVMLQAVTDNKSLENHTAHMVTHGILHLLGMDHINDKDAIQMEKAEIEILKKLSIKNPYVYPGKNKTVFFHGLACFVLGAIASFGFAPFNFWWATVLGLGAAYYLFIKSTDITPRFWKSFFSVMPFGMGYAVCMFWWVLNSIYVVPELAAQFAIWTLPGIIGIGAAGGIIFTIPFIAIRCMRLNPASRPFLFAATWAIVLWLREWLLTGFPWNPIANVMLPYPVISNSMSFWGALGLTFIIVGLIASGAELVKNKKRAIMPMVIFGVLLITGAVFGHQNIKKSADKNDSYQHVIRIVQPAESATDKATHSREQAIANAEKNIQNLISLSQSDRPADLIVFPETTYPYLVADGYLPFVKELNTTTIIGATLYNNERLYNSLLLVSASGEIEKIYSKSHLVPFGEYRPFGDIIPTPGQLTSGNGAEVIKTNLVGQDFYFAPAICYEIVFSDSLIPKKLQHQPSAIINITNDTWFGKTPGTFQHLDMVRRYAIESGLPIIRSNYSGISAFIAADGTMTASLPIGVAGNLDGTVWGSHLTVYRAIGRDLWLIIILLFSCICAISTLVFQKKD